MLREVIPDLPEMNSTDYFQEDENLAIAQFKKAERKIMLYENENGQLSVLFKKLDEKFYADFVVSLSRTDSRVKKLYIFLKLCLEGVRLVCLNSAKGFQNAARIEKHLSKIIPKDKRFR